MDPSNNRNRCLETFELQETMLNKLFVHGDFSFLNLMFLGYPR